jgi:L-threonylcarbamoyladenylate synthase
MEILKISNIALKKAIVVIRSGGIVICPTDTVYGFLADATSKKAVDAIYKIKKRPKLKPLPVFVNDIAMVKELADVNERQAKIFKKYWPGKYTFVLKRKPSVKIYGVDKKTIAIRIPNHKFLNGLLKKINRPLVQTSVNISGQPPLLKIKDIKEKFGKYKSVLIIDAGNLKKSKPSKIIDVTNNKIKIIRP